VSREQVKSYGLEQSVALHPKFLILTTEYLGSQRHTRLYP
jgi:hypothetical protein